VTSTPPRRLQLVPVGPAACIPAWLGPTLDETFGTLSYHGEPLELDRAGYDPARGQFLSAPIVDALVERARSTPRREAMEWALGVTEAELYAPGLTFIFGEATVGGCAAVVSTARLRDGAGADPRVFGTRLLAEAVHELGHVAGLDHCAREDCVMHLSAGVEDTDRKGPRPCAECRVALQRARCTSNPCSGPISRLP
jgi:archaemetzincin